MKWGSLSRKSGSLSRLKTILTVTLILNIVLAASLALLAFNYVQLSHQTNSLAEQNERLSKSLNALTKEYELLTNQLSYYKQQAEFYSRFLNRSEITEGYIGKADINIVAVKQVNKDFFDSSYEGVSMRVHVELRKGEGRLLINTQPRIGMDLQTSGKTATIVAENFTGISLRKTDVILTVIADEDVQIVDGPSAGAAITTAIIAAIANKAINQSVYITGTINPDCSIGPVGGILEKSIAASENDAKIFLVPKGQGIITIYRYEERTPFPGFTIMTPKPERIRLDDYLEKNGYELEIIEVESITQVSKYFLF